MRTLSRDNDSELLTEFFKYMNNYLLHLSSLQSWKGLPTSKSQLQIFKYKKRKIRTDIIKKRYNVANLVEAKCSNSMYIDSYIGTNNYTKQFMVSKNTKSGSYYLSGNRNVKFNTK